MLGSEAVAGLHVEVPVDADYYDSYAYYIYYFH